MVKDDPFGLSADSGFGVSAEPGRTRVRPAPAQASGYAPAPQLAGVARPTRASANPLLNAFASLLEFAPELEDA
ncbi:MAG: hypothetical protein ABTQ27_18495, partial [Amaricoccus sp.]